MMKNFAAVAELLEPWIEGQMRYNSLYCLRFSFFILSPEGIDFMHVPATPSSSEIVWSKKRKVQRGGVLYFPRLILTNYRPTKI